MKSTIPRVAFSPWPLLVAAICLSALPPLSAEALRFSAWTAPVNLGPLINTTAGESCDSISRDGLTLYFARGGNELWFSERASTESPWGVPERMGANINQVGSANFCPTLSADGHRFFFVSDRPGGCGQADMYVSYRRDTRDNLGWEPAVNLGCEVNGPLVELKPFPFVGPDGTEYLYFNSTRPGPGPAGTSDIYVSVLGPDGRWGSPALVPGLNTDFNDSRPDLRNDGLEIFFDSNRTGGGAVGGADLWSATRASLADPWSAPVDLGPVVNSSGSEQRPSLSWDGTALYFMSNRPGSLGGTDIWVTMRQRLLTTYGVTASVTFRNPYNGQSGTAHPTFLNDEFAFFDFGDPGNPEVFVKVLSRNSADWIQVLVGGTTDFEYTVSFTGCGQSLQYTKPPYVNGGYLNGTAIPKSACPK